ncbi:hypothetical protein CMUS01_02793 [Colletotrichum musicola]|uniref:Leo1-like protein n=1 Tax=Colletotrichum musicola TaxID=2175873 RepID=A0A8H6NU85_9PEZI|nr:hypothetical protein CMUS01_02793 [Colletotrichum musicola]
MSDSEELVELPEDEEEEEDLFGDEPADDAQDDRSRAGSERAGSDQDDAEGGARDEEAATAAADYRTKVIEAVEVQRHRVPKAKDQRLRSLRVPKFVRFVPTIFDPATFEPTQEDIENAKADTPKVDVRVRRRGDKLQSNAAIHRWSDGSVTMTVGDEHYEVTTKALAPGPDEPYSELKDGHYYAAAAELTSNFLMFVGHVTDQYIIRPGKDVQDDALIALAERMATVSQKPQEKDMIINTIQDPELRKRQAEQAEKEHMKAMRRRENAAARIDARGYARGGGLSIGDIEGGRRSGGARKRGMPGAAKQKRRRPEYDSDDDLPSGARRQDDYDMEDDFIVGSDEDISEGPDDDNEEILDDDDDDEAPRSKKRQRRSDDDAEGEDDLPEMSGRGRRRQVVDDDDSE